MGGHAQDLAEKDRAELVGPAATVQGTCHGSLPKRRPSLGYGESAKHRNIRDSPYQTSNCHPAAAQMGSCMAENPEIPQLAPKAAWATAPIQELPKLD